MGYIVGSNSKSEAAAKKSTQAEAPLRYNIIALDRSSAIGCQLDLLRLYEPESGTGRSRPSKRSPPPGKKSLARLNKKRLPQKWKAGEGIPICK